MRWHRLGRLLAVHGVRDFCDHHARPCLGFSRRTLCSLACLRPASSVSHRATYCSYTSLLLSWRPSRWRTGSD
jgi:hypothetical protein